MRPMKCSQMLWGSPKVQDRVEIWQRLLLKSERDLMAIKARLVSAENDRKQLAAQMDKLGRMKDDYREQLLAFGNNSDLGHKHLTMRNFITHLDRTLSLLGRQIIAAETSEREMKALYDQQYRKLNKFQSLKARALGQREAATKRKEEKARDMQNVVDFALKMNR